jgi:hypothetical protein
LSSPFSGSIDTSLSEPLAPHVQISFRELGTGRPIAKRQIVANWTATPSQVEFVALAPQSIADTNCSCIGGPNGKSECSFELSHYSTSQHYIGKAAPWVKFGQETVRVQAWYQCQATHMPVSPPSIRVIAINMDHPEEHIAEDPLADVQPTAAPVGGLYPPGRTFTALPILGHRRFLAWSCTEPAVIQGDKCQVLAGGTAIAWYRDPSPKDLEIDLHMPWWVQQLFKGQLTEEAAEELHRRLNFQRARAGLVAKSPRGS